MAGIASDTHVSGEQVLVEGEVVAQRFEIECVGALGGMSVVYRARDRETRAQVAIKVLHHSDAVAERRLEAEAKILAGIDHPSVVRYIAHGTTRQRAQGSQYIAMEWLTGEDLSQRLSRAGLRASETLALLRQVCSGLSAAHDRGILHRDIKPANVFLVGGSIDRVKLLDFGVARARTASALTRADAVIGTVGYMSPEQSRGEHDLDPRTDVFSVGALLFECLSGLPVFSGAHDLAVLTRMLREEPLSIRTLRPDLGAEFDVLLSRLLAKERTHRPASAREALELIEAAFARGTFDDRIEAPARIARTSFAERRILSVIAASPRRGRSATPQEAERDAQTIAELARDLEVEVVRWPGHTWLLFLSAGTYSAVTDQALYAPSTLQFDGHDNTSWLGHYPFHCHLHYHLLLLLFLKSTMR